MDDAKEYKIKLVSDVDLDSKFDKVYEVYDCELAKFLEVANEQIGESVKPNLYNIYPELNIVAMNQEGNDTCYIFRISNKASPVTDISKEESYIKGDDSIDKVKTEGLAPKSSNLFS